MTTKRKRTQATSRDGIPDQPYPAGRRDGHHGAARRLQGRFGSHQEAEAWLIAKCAEIDAYGPVSAKSMTFAEAATRYLLEEERAGKPSLSTESYLLEPVVECVGPG
jgi:hypothetical protein